MLSTNTGAVAGSSFLYSNFTYQANATNDVWDQFLNNQYANGGNPHGPLSPAVSFTYTIPSQPATVVVDYGRAFFYSGSTLYSINATNGNTIWTKNLISSGNSGPIISSGMLVYTNYTNITAINPITNTLIWSVPTQAVADQYAVPIAYNNKLYTAESVGGTVRVLAHYLNNGTLAWSYSLPAPVGANGDSIAVDNGAIAVLSSVSPGGPSQLRLLQDFGASANTIWAKTFNQPVSALVVSPSNNILAFMTGTTLNATYINGTTVPGFPISGATTADYYPTIYKNVIYYEGTSSLSAVSTSNTILWSYAVPSTYGTAVQSPPIVSDKIVYSTWSNGYLLANNMSTGKLLWATAISSSGTLYNYALAYGKLFTVLKPSSGNDQIIVYGGCPSSASGSILQIAASLYANGQGSCADALVNGVLPMSNYSIFLNSTFAPGISVDSFTGTNSYALNPSRAPLNTLQTFTITAWVNPSSGCATSPNIYSEGTPAGTFQFALVNAGCNLYLATWNQNTPGNWKSLTYGSLTVPQNQWTFVAAVLSVGGTSGTYTIYLNTNSISAAGQPESNPSTIYSGIGFLVGSLVGQQNQYFKGSMANMQLYNSSLTQSQILQIYRQGMQGAPLKSSGLIGWFPLAGDTNDYSGLGDTQYPANILYKPANYLPAGFINSYQVGSAGTTLAIKNYTTGLSKLYKVGVTSWR